MGVRGRPIYAQKSNLLRQFVCRRLLKSTCVVVRVVVQHRPCRGAACLIPPLPVVLKMAEDPQQFDAKLAQSVHGNRRRLKGESDVDGIAAELSYSSRTESSMMVVRCSSK